MGALEALTIITTVSSVVAFGLLVRMGLSIQSAKDECTKKIVLAEEMEANLSESLALTREDLRERKTEIRNLKHDASWEKKRLMELADHKIKVETKKIILMADENARDSLSVEHRKNVVLWESRLDEAHKLRMMQETIINSLKAEIVKIQGSQLAEEYKAFEPLALPSDGATSFGANQPADLLHTSKFNTNRDEVKRKERIEKEKAEEEERNRDIISDRHRLARKVWEDENGDPLTTGDDVDFEEDNSIIHISEVDDPNYRHENNDADHGHNFDVD